MMRTRLEKTNTLTEARATKGGKNGDILALTTATYQTAEHIHMQVAQVVTLHTENVNAQIVAFQFQAPCCSFPFLIFQSASL